MSSCSRLKGQKGTQDSVNNKQGTITDTPSSDCVDDENIESNI